MKISKFQKVFGGRPANWGIAALALVPGLASAQVDVSATVTEIGLAKTAAMAIGAAVLSVFVGIMLYKWVRRAM